MRAVHLPGVLEGQTPPYSFPTKPPPVSALEYSKSFPEPNPSPSPKSHAYLISVTATALTRGELTWDEVLDPSRFHPYGGAIPGHDVVGTVHTVYPIANGSSSPMFKYGDKVWGLLDFDRDGAAATFAIAYENELALLPEAPSSVDARQWETQLATLPLSALTAYQSLFDHGNISPELLTTRVSTVTQSSSDSNATRPRVLIMGPTGSVGLPSLYLSLAASLHTTVLTSTRHVEFLQSIDNAIVHPSNARVSLSIITRDSPTYTDLPSSFTTHSPPIPPVDLVIDTVGSSTLQSLLTSPSLSNVVRPGGKVVTIVAPIAAFGADVENQVIKNCKECNVEVKVFIVKPDGAQLSTLGKLASEGRLVGHVDAVFPLDRGRDAMEMVEGKRSVGKIVLKVAE